MTGTPSIAGIVASIDHHFVQYPASLALQESRKEVSWPCLFFFFFLNMPLAHDQLQMISALKDLMIERMRAWYRKNRAYPQNIIVYRDGVSEGKNHDSYYCILAYRTGKANSKPFLTPSCPRLKRHVKR